MMIIRTLGSLLESRIFLGTAPFGQQMHCQRNKVPYPDLSGHVANCFFSSLASKAIFPTYNYAMHNPI
jgi:hypothetical protein